MKDSDYTIEELRERSEARHRHWLKISETFDDEEEDDHDTYRTT